MRAFGYWVVAEWAISLLAFQNLLGCSPPSSADKKDLGSAVLFPSSSAAAPVHGASASSVASSANDPTVSDSLPPFATASAAASVGHAIPADIARNILGCWSFHDERWQFTTSAAKGITVVREVNSSDPSYDARARIPTELMYDEKEGTLAFSGAGPIHALLFVFKLQDEKLRGAPYSSHAPGQGYHWTGNNFELPRLSKSDCPKSAPPRASSN